jgi:CxxC motif-containing protein
MGQVVVNNIRGTEVDIVATDELKISMTVISA